jgi:hypothetical protein
MERTYVRCPECHTVVVLTTEQINAGIVLCPGVFPKYEPCGAEIDIQEAWEEMDAEGL